MSARVVDPQKQVTILNETTRVVSIAAGPEGAPGAAGASSGTLYATMAAMRAVGVAPPAGTQVTLAAYTTPGDGGGGLFVWDAASVLADNGGTVIKPTTISTGRFRRIVAGALEVRWFGAVGDGVINDTAAVQAAIDAANTAGGGKVVFPAGTFPVTLTTYGDIHLEGAGMDATILKLPNGTNGSAVITTEDFATLTGTDGTDCPIRWGISNLTIDGNRANNTAGWGIRSYGYDFRVFQIFIHDCANDGWWSEAMTHPGPGNRTVAAHVYSVKIGENGDNGLNWLGPHDSNLFAITAHRNNQNNNGSVGVWVHGNSFGSQFVNCHVWGNTQDYAWKIEAIETELISCVGESGRLAEVYINDDGAQIVGGWYYNSVPVAYPGAVAFKIGDVSGTQIRDAHVTGFVTPGCVVQWDGTTGGTHVIDVMVYQTTGSVMLGTAPALADYMFRGFGGATFPTNRQVYPTAFTQLSTPPDTSVFVKDEFLAGGTTINSSTIGDLGWFASNTGSVGAPAGLSGHPGIKQRSTGASAGTYAALALHSAVGTGTLDASNTFDTTWIVRLNTNDADTTVRVGLGLAVTTNPPTDGVYLEKLAADTQWFGVTRAASSQTRTAALASVTTGWLRVRIRRVDGSTVGFTLDGGTEVTATLTIPTGGLIPFLAIYNNAAVAAKTLDIDYFSLLATGLAR